MTNKKLATKIYAFLPEWELPHLTKKENLQSIMQELTNIEYITNLYNYLMASETISDDLQVILNELKSKMEKLCET